MTNITTLTIPPAAHGLHRFLSHTNDYNKLFYLKLFGNSGKNTNNIQDNQFDYKNMIKLHSTFYAI